MNSEFSDRIKDINGHAEGSKDQKRKSLKNAPLGSSSIYTIASTTLLCNKRGRDTAFEQFITPLMHDINTVIWRERAEKGNVHKSMIGLGLLIGILGIGGGIGGGGLSGLDGGLDGLLGIGLILIGRKAIIFIYPKTKIYITLNSYLNFRIWKK
ncbi:hypothetical protein RhiirA1_392836 [Rhizophagus irregularis]|uniref:Uncharacterized protein n=1 Tax=Rhizophagus irregularis TaxID=588596 RepID=A0A2N0RZ15_9GLOM|nr:hypothetical protein RhiirA1_392836 [Rhizophagus irregularis]